MAYKIDPEKCPQNHKCVMVDVCPVEAITQVGFGLPVIDEDSCIECGACAEICGKQAVYLP